MSNEQPPDRTRTYQRWCPDCRRLDTAPPLIAGSPSEAGAALHASAWSCPHCGGTAFDVTSTYQDGDLDSLPVPIAAARVVRETLDDRRPTS